ncbi:uncharacterized protein LOC135083701 [Ostrinia nubilalis]|uniref:uncharacterized protein LOC135083701 n=1 Tax=Ostrinia nubilalis TaxID=29057 RepID=UPI0030825AE7
MRVRLQTLFVLWIAVLSNANEDYENKLTKLWSVSRSSNSDGSAVLNVTSASIVIQPSSYGTDQVARASRERKYAFKPRAIPLRRAEAPQVERNVYYSDDVNKYKSEVLFPGNYFPIAKEKSNENLTKDSVYQQVFHPKSIPLIRSQEFHARSLDTNSDPIIEKPESFSEQPASRRSLSYIFGEDDADEDIEGDDEELEREDSENGSPKHKSKKPKIKKTKLKKYVLPLLLAYKMKYFALVPVMIGGLILLVGATGLAGFFFALFAAVMGLQKGGGY